MKKIMLQLSKSLIEWGINNTPPPPLRKYVGWAAVYLVLSLLAWRRS